MTTLIILTFVTITLILVAILVLYAIGKINSIEQATQQLMTPGDQQPAKSGASAGPFNGLEGKPLWDMLSGKTIPDGVAQSELESFREQYAPVLLKAIKAIFADGQNDSKYGQPRGSPKNDRPVKTLRLSINTWLPSHDVSNLYNAGYDSMRAQDEERDRLRLTVSETAGSLFAKLQMATPAGLVDSLIAQGADVLLPGAETEDDHKNSVDP
jgi:hypothetical protein